MNAKVKLTDLVNWLVNEALMAIKQHENKPTLKLIDVEYSTRHGHEICRIQVIGKNVYPLFTAKEIITTKKLLDSFSHEDIVKITRLMDKIENEKSSNELTIVESPRQGIGENDNSLVVQRIGSNMLFKLRIKDIFERKLLKFFRKEDVYKIGYYTGRNTAEYKLPTKKRRKLSIVK